MTTNYKFTFIDHLGNPFSRDKKWAPDFVFMENHATLHSYREEEDTNPNTPGLMEIYNFLYSFPNAFPLGLDFYLREEYLDAVKAWLYIEACRLNIDLSLYSDNNRCDSSSSKSEDRDTFGLNKMWKANPFSYFEHPRKALDWDLYQMIILMGNIIIECRENYEH